MFDFLKNFFKPAENENVFQPAPPRPTAPAQTPATQFQAKYPRQTAPTPSAHPTSENHANHSGSMALPLSSVLAGLPIELKGRVRQIEIGDATLSISVDRVMTQLPHGAVTLPFGELRKAAPELFTTAADFDQVEVALPLNEILSRVNPATLVRRQNQRQVEIPSEISSPFGENGQGLAFSPAPAKTPAPAPAARSIRPATPAPEAPASPATPSHPAPASAPVQRPRPIGPLQSKAFPAATPFSNPRVPAPAAQTRPQPVSPTPTPAPAKPASIPLNPFQPSAMRNPVAPAPATPPPAATPIQQVAPAAPAPVAPSEPPPSIPVSSALRSLGASIGVTPGGTSLQPRVRPTAPQTAQPAAEVPTLAAPLNSLSEGWPEALRQEIVQLKLTAAHIAMPVDQIEAAMKRGKIAFQWMTIRSWIRPAVLPSVSAHDSTVVELPLRIIAPLFLARNKQATAHQQKVAVDENIPNLFFGFPQPDAEAAAPVAPEPASAPLASHSPLSHPVAKPVETNYYVWNDASESANVDETTFKRQPTIQTNFLSRKATPNEVVARAIGLEGVEGTLVALPDGLMVSSKLPPNVNGDTLAGFLPQIFGKVSQCTKELRMGELNNLNFTVGNVPWKIFRVNAIFFAAFGRAGQGLPTAELSALAAELDRKKVS